MNIRMDMLTSGQWPDKNCYAIYESKQIGRNQTQDWYAARFPDLNFVAGGKKLQKVADGKLIGRNQRPIPAAEENAE